MNRKLGIDTSEIKIHPDEDYKPKKDKTKKDLMALFKKNETPFIVLGGCLIVCVVFYFLFGLSSGQPESGSGKLSLLEERVALLEQKISALGGGDMLITEENGGESLAERFNQFEAATSLKVSVMERQLAELLQNKRDLEKIVAQMNEQKKTAVAEKKVAAVTTAPPQTQQTRSVSTHKKSAPVYHSVRKGETYYSISRKYGLSVQQLLDLNNLKLSQAIYPDQKLLVKP